MKVKIEGSRNGVRWPGAGGVKDLPDSEAIDLLNAGLAEPVQAQKAERAVAKAPKTRTRKES